MGVGILWPMGASTLYTLKKNFQYNRRFSKTDFDIFLNTHPSGESMKEDNQYETSTGVSNMLTVTVR